MSFIEDIERRTKWFLNDRFGMFIHFGLYATPARGEWVQSHEEIPDNEYRKYFDEFNPTLFDAKEWARTAKNAGMKYAILTAKHHDGFCLFDSKLTDYTSVNTKAGRDIVREYVEAFRAEGIKVGIYFSIIDWYHPDYPSYGDMYHPDRARLSKKDDKHDFDNYLKFMYAQVEELMTNYGRIDILWTDFSYGEMIGEKWGATKLVRMIRRLQPDIILNSRLEGSGDNFGSLKTDNPTELSGDFSCPEMIIPMEGLTTPTGRNIPWEACFTINNSWGYNSLDKYFKPSSFLIKKLVECTSKNGNMLLNIAPTPRGNLAHEQVAILKEIGEWLTLNGESIYGCGKCDLPKPEWGRFTQKDDTIYAHIMEPIIGPIGIANMKGRFTDPRKLKDQTEMYNVDSWIVAEFKDDCFISFDKAGVATYPDEFGADTVVRLKLKQPK